MNQYDHLRSITTGRTLGALWSPSMKMGVSVDEKICLRSVAKNRGVFLAGMPLTGAVSVS